MMFAKISTARKFLLGPILDTDGVAKTDEVVASIKVTKNGTVGTVDAQSTLAHSHTGHYVFDAVDGGDFDTAGEVEFSLNSTTNAMAPVKFQVLPAVNFDALFATAPGAATGLMIAGSNAATTLANLTVSGTSALGAVTATTIAASGAVTAASLTMSGALQAATIVSTGTTTLNALTVTGACTHGSTVLGNTTAGTVTQTGAASWGATTIASMAVTGALSVGTTTTLTGAVSCGATFDVVGALTAGSVSIDATMDVVGALTCASFGVDGALSVGTTTTLTGAVSLESTLAVTGATTFTGNVAAAAGITVTQSTVNGHGIVSTGNGIGAGLRCIAGASGHGINASASAGGGHGIHATASGVSGDGIYAYADGANAAGIACNGGMQGFYAYSPTGPGIEVIGGTADIKGDLLGTITGNLVGTVSTCTTNTDMLTAAAVNAEVDTALADIHLDHLLAVDYDPASKPGTATALLNELVESDSGVSRFTVNALEQGPSGSGASAAAIADAVWDEVLHTDHEVAGSSSVLLQAAGTGADAAAIADAVWDEVVTGHDGAGKAGARLWTDIPAILDDTGTAGVIVASIATNAITAAAIADNAIDAAAFAADAITAAKVAADVGTEIGTAVWATAARALTDKAGFSLAADQSSVTIGTVTLVTTATTLTNLPAAPSDWLTAAAVKADAVTKIQTGLATATNLATVAGYLDTEIAEILADTAELQAEWANGGRLDLIVDAILEDTGTTLDGRIPTALVTGRMSSDAVAISGSTSAADKLELSALSIETGAAAAGTLSTTQMSTTLTEATADHYVGRIIIWTSGVLIRQATDITAYNGTTKVLTFTAVTEAATAGDTFIIV